MRGIAPLVVLDLHEYPVDAALWSGRFGAVQRFDVLLQYATTANMPPFVTKAAEEWFRAPLVSSLGAAGFSSDWYHTISADPADRRVSMGSAAPQLGRNAHGLMNAVSLLVETRGGGIGRTDFKRRVQAQLTAVASVLGNAASRAADLAKLRQFVDRDVAASACKGEGVIEAGLTPSEYALPMLDPQTGAIRRVTVTWESALELRVVKTRPRACGYWLAASETEAVRRLRLLGIEVLQLELAGEMRGETYRETGRDAAAAQGGGAPAGADPADPARRSRRQLLRLARAAARQPGDRRARARVAGRLRRQRRDRERHQRRPRPGAAGSPRHGGALSGRARARDPAPCKNGPLRADERVRPRRWIRRVRSTRITFDRSPAIWTKAHAWTRPRARRRSKPPRPPRRDASTGTACRCA